MITLGKKYYDEYLGWSTLVPNFYDVDTSMGLENQGKLVHNYDIEIGDVDACDRGFNYFGWPGILLNFFKVELRVRFIVKTKVLHLWKYFLSYEQIYKISKHYTTSDTFPAKYIGVTTCLGYGWLKVIP